MHTEQEWEAEMDEATKRQLRNFVIESIALSGEPVNESTVSFAYHYQAAVFVFLKARERHVSAVEIYRNLHPTISDAAAEDDATFYRSESAEYKSQRSNVPSFKFPLPHTIPYHMTQFDRVVRRLCLMGLTMSEEQRARRAEDLMLQGLAILPFPDENRRVFRLYHNALRLRLKLPWLDISRNDKQFYDDLILGFRSEMLAD